MRAPFGKGLWNIASALDAEMGPCGMFLYKIPKHRVLLCLLWPPPPVCNRVLCVEHSERVRSVPRRANITDRNSPCLKLWSWPPSCKHHGLRESKVYLVAEVVINKVREEQRGGQNLKQILLVWCTPLGRSFRTEHLYISIPVAQEAQAAAVQSKLQPWSSSPLCFSSSAKAPLTSE